MNYAERGASKYFRIYGQRFPIDRGEFVSAAYYGLVIAARKFDSSRGVKFTTYSFQWINRYLRMVTKEYRRQNGWTWHTAGLPDGSGANKMEKVLHSVGWPTIQQGDGDEKEWDAPAPEPIETVDDALETAALRQRVLATASTHKDRLILQGRLDGRTLEDIGQELGISRERVRQLFEIAFQRAKDALSEAS